MKRLQYAGAPALQLLLVRPAEGGSRSGPESLSSRETGIESRDDFRGAHICQEGVVPLYALLVWGLLSSQSRSERSTVLSSKTFRVSVHFMVSLSEACAHRSGEGWMGKEAKPH